jgi:hypothetical protein
MTLGFRYIDLLSNFALSSDGEELAMVRLDRIEAIPISNEAVRDTIWLKVRFVGVCCRVSFHECTKVSDNLPCAGCGIDLNDGVGNGWIPVRASPAFECGIQLAVKKSEVGDAEEVGGHIADCGRKSGGYDHSFPRTGDFRNCGSETAGVGSDRWDDLCALTVGGG